MIVSRPVRGHRVRQPRFSRRPTAAIISSVRSSCCSGSAPITQVCACPSSSPSATLSSAAWAALIWVRMSMQYRSSGDHSLDPADLTFDPRQPREQLVLGGGVAPGGRLSLRHIPDSTSYLYPLGVSVSVVLHERARRDLARPAGLVPDGVGGVVGARARVRDLRDRAGVGAARADRGADERLRRAFGRLGDWARGRLLVVLLRRDRDRASPCSRRGRAAPRRSRSSSLRRTSCGSSAWSCGC